jgi:hypothetical protein
VIVVSKIGILVMVWFFSFFFLWNTRACLRLKCIGTCFLVCGFLGYDTVQSGRLLPAFWRNQLRPSLT